MAVAPEMTVNPMFPDEHSRSAQLHARGKRVIPGGSSRASIFYEPYPVYAARGRGCRVTDVDGNEYVDFVNNMSSLIHGHGHPRVMQAVHQQADRLLAVAMPTEAEVQLAEELCRRLGSVEQVTFVNSGTEAVMIAIRAARALTGRSGVAKVEGAYHGAYDEALVSVAPTRAQCGPASAPTSVPDCAGLAPRVLDSVVVLPFNDVAASERMLRRHGESLAAVIIDPVVSRMGLVRATPGYLAALRRVTRELGVLLIFDEVLSFRLSFGGAQAYVGVEPDLTALGKLVGGGFPIGAVGGSRDVMAVFDLSRERPPVPHSGTYNANPMSMVAGLATLELLQPPEFERLAMLATRARAGLAEAMASARLPGRVMAEGSLLYIHYEDVDPTDYRTLPLPELQRERAGMFHRLMLNQGILVPTFGGLVLSTPMGQDEIDHLVERSRECFRLIARTLA